MSDNALAKSRDFLRSKTFPNLNFEQNLIADLADALERADADTAALVARVRDAELALAVYDEAVVSEYWERWPPAESPAP